MPSLVNYHGLQVLSPDPTGDGGLAIQNDLKSLVDWSPKSVWNGSADPTAGDDENDDFFPGSFWLRTDTTPARLFVCQSSTASSAVWVPLTPPLRFMVSKTAAYTITTSDDIVLCDATGAAFTVTLPTAVGNTGRQLVVKRLNSGSNAVTVAAAGSETIDGASTVSLSTQYQVITMVSDGSNWAVI
ncbi:MAG: hypothetical protein KDA85_08920 [Planctomycetaceae bacterium]|nr:hypothetical protein [Planctomycetaceae bacterium]